MRNLNLEYIWVGPESLRNFSSSTYWRSFRLWIIIVSRHDFKLATIIAFHPLVQPLDNWIDIGVGIRLLPLWDGTIVARFFIVILHFDVDDTIVNFARHLG